MFYTLTFVTLLYNIRSYDYLSLEPWDKYESRIDYL